MVADEVVIGGDKTGTENSHSKRAQVLKWAHYHQDTRLNVINDDIEKSFARGTLRRLRINVVFEILIFDPERGVL